MNQARILIVDDDTNISNLVALLRRKLGGHEVRTESRSYSAVTTAEQFNPDIAILDVDMPGKDGGEVAAELHAHPRFGKLPIIFLTSLVSPVEAKARPTTRDGKPFLSKPVDPQMLIQTVMRMLTDAAVPVAA